MVANFHPKITSGLLCIFGVTWSTHPLTSSCLTQFGVEFPWQFSVSGHCRWGELPLRSCSTSCKWGLDPSVWGRWKKTKEIPMSVAHLTQKLLLVLTISKWQGSRVSCCFLVHSSRVLLASCFLFLDGVLPSVGGTFDWHVAFAPRSLKPGSTWPTTTREVVDYWCCYSYGHWHGRVHLSLSEE
jgi:hypothetical protein